ncbi:MAG: ParB/RepB/Spo0J family partition protein [Phycisphaerae bacterium]|nr:ParB/RepB/Spo0J family partition protein [Phycisphaerae bacterium]
MTHKYDDPVQFIPIDQINIVNTRSRGKEKFKEIVSSIRNLGLKKPITISPASGKYGPGDYDLVCGEGRILAFLSLGEKVIPARIQSMSNEDVMLMSLVENLARRQVHSAELLKEIAALKKRGYKISQIAVKTDLTTTYVSAILRLLSYGEKALLQAVEKRRVPLSVAISIATSDDEGIQKALHDAYEQNLLRGKKLLRVREFIEKRRAGLNGKKAKKGKPKSLSTYKMLKAYRDETTRQRAVVKQAQLCQRQLLYVVSALKRLFTDENFINLLRAESLDSLPQYLAEEVL